MHGPIRAVVRGVFAFAVVFAAMGQNTAVADALYGAAHSGPSGASTLLRIDPLTGTAVPVGPIGFEAVSGLDFHPVSEVLYGVGRRPVGGPSVLIRIDPATGAGQFVGFTGIETLGGGGLFHSIADISFRGADSTLYAYLEPNDGLATIDVTTGAATFLGFTGSPGCCGNGIAFGSTDVLFHATENGTGTVFLDSIDQATGATTVLSSVTFAGFPALTRPKPNAMDFHPSSRVAFVSINDGSQGNGPNYLGTLDPISATVSFLGPTANGLDALAWKAESCRTQLYGSAYSGPDGLSTLYRIDPFTGIGQLVGPIGFERVGSIDFHPFTSVLYGVGERVDGTNTPVLLTIDPTTGQGTEVGPLISTFVGGGHFDISFRNADAVLYLIAFDSTGASLGEFRVSLATGFAAPIGPTGTIAPGNAQGFTATDRLFHSDAAAGGSYYEVDQITGASVLVGPLAYVGFPALANPRLNAMDFVPGANVAFAALNVGAPSFLSRFDPSTGNVFHVGATVADLDGLAWRPECDDRDPCTLDFCVPEPEFVLYGAAHTGSNGLSRLMRIDPDTGSATVVGDVHFQRVGAMDFHPATGVLYGVGERPDGTNTPVLLTIDPATGAGTEVGPLVNTPPAGHFDASFRNSDGVLFVTAFHPMVASVAVYTVDLSTGTATLVGPTGTIDPGNALAFSASDRLLHSDSAGGGTLYEVNQATGASVSFASLSYAGFPPLTGLPRLNAMDFHPESARPYVVLNDNPGPGGGGGGPVYLALLDPGSGTVSHIGLSATGLDALAWRHVRLEDVLYGVSKVGGIAAPSRLLRIDPANGAATSVGDIGFNGISSLDFHPTTDALYAVGFRPVTGVSVLLTIDPATGAGTEVGPTGLGALGFGDRAADISFREGDGVLFAYVEGGDAVATIDVTTGAATLVGPSGVACCGNALAFGATDVLFHGNDGGLNRIDQTTGAAGSLGFFNYVGFPAMTFPRPNAMDYNPLSGSFFVSINENGGSHYLARLDLGTNNLSFLGPTAAGLDGLAWHLGRGRCAHRDQPDQDADGHCDLIDNCAEFPNPSQQPALFGLTVYVLGDKTTFSWGVPKTFFTVRGLFTTGSDIGAWTPFFAGSGFGSSLSSALIPPANSGIYYLFRPDCAAASWSSGGPSELPGRDASLP